MTKKKSKKSGFQSGLILSVDPGSFSLGLSLWNTKGELLDTFTAKGQKGDTWAVRFQDMFDQMQLWFTAMGLGEDDITEVIYEKINSFSHVGLTMVCGIIFMSRFTRQCNVRKENGIGPASWKKWAKEMGSKNKDPKGIDTLQEIFGELDFECDSDDVADSVMIALTWMEKNLK